MQKRIVVLEPAMSATLSTLSEVWLDGNRQAVEVNTFFSLAIEPDAIVKVTPDLKKDKWMHRQAIEH